MIGIIVEHLELEREQVYLKTLKRPWTEIAPRFIYAISKSRWDNVLVDGEPVSTPRNRESKMMDLVINWITTAVIIFCDAMPNSEERHLPMYFTWDALYKDFVKDHKDEDQICTSRYFKAVRKRFFPYLKIPKHTRLGNAILALP